MCLRSTRILISIIDIRYRPNLGIKSVPARGLNLVKLSSRGTESVPVGYRKCTRLRILMDIEFRLFYGALFDKEHARLKEIKNDSN